MYGVESSERCYHMKEGFVDSPDHGYNNEAVELSFVVDTDELEFDMRGLVADCMNATIAKKRSLEIKERLLAPREKLAFRAAKRKEVSSWLHNSVLRLLTQHGIPRHRCVRCRWVLTWKKVDAAEDSAHEALSDLKSDQVHRVEARNR